MTQAEEIVAGLSERDRRVLMATPSMIHGDAGYIGHLCGLPGIAVAGVAKRHRGLFQRIRCDTQFTYRLGPLGLAVRDALKGQP